MSNAEMPVYEPHHAEPDDKPSAGPLDPIEPSVDNEIVGSDEVTRDLRLVTPGEPDWQLDKKTQEVGSAGVRRAKAILAATTGGDVLARERYEAAQAEQAVTDTPPPPLPLSRTATPDSEQQRAS